MGSRVLFVSPHRADAVHLGRMLEGTPLILDYAPTLAAARARLARDRFAAVLTEALLPDGGWLDVLDAVRSTARGVEVLVTRPVVDARFWAEVLNMRGYDMLAQPFSEAEVRHVLTNVCSRIPNAVPVPAPCPLPDTPVPHARH